MNPITPKYYLNTKFEVFLNIAFKGIVCQNKSLYIAFLVKKVHLCINLYRASLLYTKLKYSSPTSR